MRRLALLFPLLLTVAGCGGAPRSSPRVTQPATLTFSEPSASPCHTRVPPSAGECVAQRYGFHAPTATSPSAPLTVSHGDCADLSQWQGYAPNLTGLRCVIIQASYGLNEEPSLYSQIRDANEHHVPWGAYAFLEGNSGAAEARLAAQLTSGHGRTLGVWADAEIGAAYSHACEFTGETRALKVHIYGLFAAPGMWPGGRCDGWLWPSEWDVPAVYAFAGYPSSAIKLWQDCGSCSRYGVKTDRDVDEGLLALARSKPKPPTKAQLHRQLERDYTLRRELRGLISKHECRTHIHRRPCPVWFRQGTAVNNSIRALHARGIY